MPMTPRADEAAFDASTEGLTANVSSAFGGAPRHIALVFDERDAVWRGAVDHRERLPCEILPDAALTLGYAVEWPTRATRMSVKCSATIDGLSAEARAATAVRRGADGAIVRARRAALTRLRRVIRDEMDECDARFRTLMDAGAWAGDDDEALLVAVTPLGAPPVRGRGAYLGAGEPATATRTLAGQPSRGGYVGLTSRLRASRGALGTYGESIVNGGGATRGGMLARGQSRARGGAMDAVLPSAAHSATVEALGLSLLRLQNILTALERVTAADG